MVTVTILVVLMSVAVSLYEENEIRSDLSDANSRLLNAQVVARTYFTNARTYVGFCATYPEFSSRLTDLLRFTCSEDRYCFRVRIEGTRSLSNFKSLVSETGPRTISVPHGWTMPVNASNCLIASKKGDCI